MRHVLLAVEDSLSGVLGRKILLECGLLPGSVLGLRGNGYLRKKAPELNRAAAQVPMLMLTDRDKPSNCPVKMVQEWLTAPRNEQFLLRIAVMEIESWVLADNELIARFFSLSSKQIPDKPDELSDPKAELLRLAAVSKKRELRQDLLPRKGSTAKIGPAYNAVLGGLVENDWNPIAASRNSPSLLRTLRALSNLRATLES